MLHLIISCKIRTCVYVSLQAKFCIAAIGIHICIDLFFSALSRSSSGSSCDLQTPIKVLQKDVSTGELIVRMSPEDFDRISTQNLCSRYLFIRQEISLSNHLSVYLYVQT